jgi:hypothetical protein
MRAQYANTPESCNKYRQIHHQLPNDVISRSTTLPPALALHSVSRRAKLGGLEIRPSAPQFASSHAMIWSSRLPKPSGGTTTLILTGNRRSAFRAACCAALMKRPGDCRWDVHVSPGFLVPADRDR